MDLSEINQLHDILEDIENNKDTTQVHKFMGYVIDAIRDYNGQKHKLDFEIQLADKIYNQFAQDDNELNITNHLLAANLIKFNKIIEKNDEIIKLLNEIKD